MENPRPVKWWGDEAAIQRLEKTNARLNEGIVYLTERIAILMNEIKTYRLQLGLDREVEFSDRFEGI